MVRALRILAAFGLAAAAFPMLAHGEWLSPRVSARLVRSWIEQGFWRTGEIYDPPRHPNGNQVRHVGDIRAGRRTYSIYFDQVSDPQTEHGHQDVVVSAERGRLLGFYEVSDTQLEPLLTKGADILFEPFEDDPHNHDRARIHFGANGPPRKTVLNGYDLLFETPENLPKHFRKLKPAPDAPAPR